MASSSARTGAAGAFYTAALLAQHGWDASLTIGNTPRMDVVAQHYEHQTLIAVQCKATTGDQTFLLSKGCESPSPRGRNEWLILVPLRGSDVRPDFFIVPRNVAAAYIYVGHQAWLTVPAKNGQPHQPNTMRDVEQRAVKHYKERWDLLEQPVETVPYWLSDWVFDWAPRTGLPLGHPGLRQADRQRHGRRGRRLGSRVGFAAARSHPVDARKLTIDPAAGCVETPIPQTGPFTQLSRYLYRDRGSTGGVGTMGRVPTISRFFGIAITMYFDDHGPPHFHARHAASEAKIRIDTLEVIDSNLDRRHLRLVLAWAELHPDARGELATRARR